MVLDWGATDQGLVDAFARVGIDIKDAVPDVKAILAGTQAMQPFRPDTAARPTEVVLDGLRPRPTLSGAEWSAAGLLSAFGIAALAAVSFGLDQPQRGELLVPP